MKKLQSLGFAFVAVALIGLLCCVNSATAQEVTGSVTGTVLDQNGAAIAGAAVTAKDIERGVVWPAQTNDQGIYTLSRLPVGTYEVTAEVKGFQTAHRAAFTLAVNQTARVDFQMKVGEVTQTVEVTSLSPLLQTESAQVGTLFDAKTVETLPLAGGNYVQLTLLTPGAVHPNPKSFSNGSSGGADPESAGRPYINGNREQSNNFLLDGVENDDSANNEVAYTPMQDSIQEFNLITQNASAEFGNFQGGIISVILKSGSNHFHGTAFDFFRNDVLNANKWSHGFAAAPPPGSLGADPRAKDKVRYNQFGATVGGPIKRDKLFFFADYQGTRYVQPRIIVQNLFTNAERNGDFSALGQQLFNPFSVDPVTGNRAPFVNNQIPLSLINPVAKNLFASPFYPAATQQNTLIGNFAASQKEILKQDQGDIKVDYNISEKDHVFGRFSRMALRHPTSTPGFLIANGGSAQNTFPVYSATINWTHAFTTNILNEFRAGANYEQIDTALAEDASLGNLGTTLGIANGNAGGLGLPSLEFANASANGVGDRNSSQKFSDSEFQYNDTLVITHGRHTIHTGFEYERYRVNALYAGTIGVMGFFGFSGQYTSSNAVGGTGGAGEADFFLGLNNTFGRGASQNGWGQRASLYAAFAQDDWKVTNNLTLNIGLRYNTQTPWVEVNDRQINFGLFDGAVQVLNQNVANQLSAFTAAGGIVKQVSNRGLYNGYYGALSFQPRIGFAWSPEALHRRTVIRGAYTISSFLEGTGDNNRLPQNVPFVTQLQTNYGGNLPATTVDQGVQTPPPGGDPFAGATLRLFDPNFQPSVVQQWNLSVQHQFSNTVTLQVGYVGQHGTHLTNISLLSQKILSADNKTAQDSPFLVGNPVLKNDVGGAIRITQANANQTYNALQANLEKRFGHGLQGNVAYTYSKCIADSNGFFGSSFNGNQTSVNSNFAQNIYDPRAERGACNFDATHSLASYVVYEIPIGRGRALGKDLNPVVNAFVGGWNVSGIMTHRSGFALTTYGFNSGAAGLNLNNGTFRPDCTRPFSYPRTPFAGGGGGIQWFNPASFTEPAGFGNCGQGVLRGPTLHTFDLGLQKDIHLGETRKLQFRAEILNLTNTPILNAPGTTEGGGFGVITSAQGERNIQLALKFYY